MFPKLLVGFHDQPHDQSLIQLENRGIFDKAASRIAREEDEKNDAIQKLQQMQADQEVQDKIDVNHEKNLKEAEKQAREMLASAKDETMQLAEEKL